LPPSQLDAATILCHAGLLFCGALPAALAQAAISLSTRPLPAGASWPTLREVAAFGRLLSQLLERGWAAPDAARTAWRQAYALAGTADTLTAGLVGADVARLVQHCSSAPGSLVHPLAWPMPLCVNELADASLPCYMRRELALVAASAASAVFSAVCSSLPNDAGCAAVSAWIHESPAIAGHLSAGVLHSLLSGSMPHTADVLLHESRAQLRAAASLFLEAATPSDAGERAHMLRLLLERVTPTTGILAAVQSLGTILSDLSAAASAAAALADHRVLELLQHARVRTTVARQQPDLLASVPIDLDCAVTHTEEEQFYAVVKGAAADAGTHSEHAASAIALFTCEALAAATCDGLLARATLSAEAAAAHTSAAEGGCTHLALALARAASPAERIRRAPAHASLDALPPVLAAVEAVEQATVEASVSVLASAVATACSADLARAASTVAGTVQQLQSLSQLRDRSLALLRSPAGATDFPAESLLLAWLRLRKPLSHLCSALLAADAAAPAAAVAAVAAAAMDHCWGIDALGVPKPVLWRFAGHPSLPSSPTTLSLESDLRSLCESAALAHDPALRHALAQAVCFFSWTHVGAESSCPVLAAGEAQDVLALAQAKAAAAAAVVTAAGPALASDAPEQPDVDANAAACDAALEQSQGAALSYPWSLERWPAGAASAAELRSIAVLSSLRASPAVLTMLTRAACHDVPESTVAALVQASHASTLLMYGLDISGRSPLDFAPLQQAVWLAERAADDAGAASQLVRSLPAASHELWYRFHVALWTPRAQVRGGAEPAWAAAAGPVALVRPTLTACLGALAGHAGGACVAERPAALLQLRLAARSVRRGELLGAVPDAAASQPLASCDRVAVQVLAVQLLRAYAATTPVLEHAAALLAQHSAAGTAAAAAALDVACKTEASLATQVLQPLLHALASPAAAAGSPADEASRGAAWAYLGAARLALLSAELVADPAARDAFKLHHLQARRDERLEPDAALRAAAATLPGARPSARRRHRCCAEIASVDARVAKLASRVIPRPVPSVWSAARAEIERFAGGLGCVTPLLLSALSAALPCSVSCFPTQRRKHGRAFLRDTHHTSYSFGALSICLCPSCEAIDDTTTYG
jgi:hypothetical protein